MSEPALRDEAPAAVPRRSRLRRILLVASCLIAAVVGVFAYVVYWQDRELREAIAEADRLDPGWHFEDIQAARAEVPDDENGAKLVLAARAKMPANWLAPTAAGVPTLDMRLIDVPPPQRPGEADLKELRERLGKPEVAKALEVARGLADRPRGRYAVTWTRDLVGTLVPHVQEARDVTRLLALDARLRALDGDTEGAVRSCQGALNAGRSLGDEPLPVSQLVRAACDRQALRALEQTLALGVASPKALEELQRLLQEEAEAPLELTAARSERVTFYQCLEVMRTGRFNRASYGLRTSFLGSTGDDLLDRGKARACQAAYLRYYNQVVEAVKRPTEDQQEVLETLHEPNVQLPTLLEALTRRAGESGWGRWASAYLQAKAELRCAAAALAAERYRLATGSWPKGLDTLVPDYLPAVPADPFDGKPLRLAHLPDGLVIYSLGPDRTDDGGKIDRSHPGAPNTDVGFQLWNVDWRGKK
jgi:hypothetical protein